MILNETRDKFLIAKEANGTWELPGGSFEWGTTPSDDLKREIREEMGLEVISVARTPSYFLYGETIFDPKIWIAQVVFEAKLASLDFTPSDECTEVRFVDKDDLKDIKAFPQVVDLGNLFDPKNHT